MASGKKFLLIGGLGHTDLSGKVPRLGLLILRKVLEKAGHSANIMNFSTSLSERLFPENIVSKLRKIFRRSVKPLFLDNPGSLIFSMRLPLFIYDRNRLKKISKELQSIEVHIFIEAAKELVKEIKENGYDAVGFSLYLGSSTNGSIVMADIIKKAYPDVPVFFGGPQTTHFARTIYRETESPTAQVLGEGELAITGIAERLDSLKKGKSGVLREVPNLVFRSGDGSIVETERKRITSEEWVGLSAAPYREHDFDGVMKYVFIETSRGCSYQCRFCPQPLLSGTERYLKSAKNIVDEMEFLNSRFGIAGFEFVGSSTPPHQAEEVADEIILRRLEGRFTWVLFMRGKDEATGGCDQTVFFNKLKKAGAGAIFFGVEAADDETLRKMGKKGTVKETKNAMIGAKEAGIATIGSFIYPYPGMPVNEDSLILEFLKETAPLSAPVQSLGLYPGTYCADHAEEIGCEVIYPERRSQKLCASGKKSRPTLQNHEILSYLLKYSLFLSLPMSLWHPLPYKIDGKSYKEYVHEVNVLQKKISRLGILTGFSHSHYLISRIIRLTPMQFFARMFYLTFTGDPKATTEFIDLFNSNCGRIPGTYDDEINAILKFWKTRV